MIQGAKTLDPIIYDGDSIGPSNLLNLVHKTRIATKMIVNNRSRIRRNDLFQFFRVQCSGIRTYVTPVKLTSISKVRLCGNQTAHGGGNDLLPKANPKAL